MNFTCRVRSLALTFLLLLSKLARGTMTDYMQPPNMYVWHYYPPSGYEPDLYDELPYTSFTTDWSYVDFYGDGIDRL